MVWRARGLGIVGAAAIIAAGAGLSACVGDEPAIPIDTGDGGEAGALADTGAPDSTVDEGEAGDDALAPSEGGCAATQLSCNGGCVAADDPSNCGSCGHDCTNLPHVAGTVTCVSGTCTLAAGACQAGFAHCDGGADLGCETNIATAAQCGACGNACPTGMPLCSSGSGTYACVSGCGGSAPDPCGSSCVNTANDPQNCGKCGQVCTDTVPNSLASCSGGVCGHQCTASYPDACDGGCVNPLNDSANCGSCGTKCTGGKTCQNGGCGCPGGTHDCGGTCANNNSTASCGATACSPCAVPAHGSATCNGSTCGISCTAPYAACGTACVDESLNGNCGGCGVTCSAACIGSQCAKAVAITAGFEHVCALLSNGQVECWGGNAQDQLGAVTCPSSVCTSPHVVPGVTGAKAIAAGEAHVCAVLSDGTVACWGDNTYGQLGGASSGTCMTKPCSATPIKVVGVTGAIAVASGRTFSCALISGGTVKCWGDNSLGQLGNGSFTNSATAGTASTVSGLTGVSAIAVGGYHACALTSNLVKCWGDDSVDELGSAPASCDPGGDQCSTTPVASGADVATAIGAGGPHTCAVEGGQVQCWGYNAAGLGDVSTTTQSYSLVRAANINNATSVAAGDYGFCAVTSASTVECWGTGPLGNGLGSDSPTPVLVMNLSNPTAVAVGAEGACALLASGAVWCWSSNSAGELGNGTTSPDFLPTPVVF